MPQPEHHFWQSDDEVISQQSNEGFGAKMLCTNWKATLKETCKMKDDRFILEYIVFQRNEDKRIFRFVEEDGPLTPPLHSVYVSSLSSCTLSLILSHTNTHIQEAHAAPQTHTRLHICTCTQSTDRIYFALS